MDPQDIPTDILAFLSTRIDTVPQLETLLMMSERQDHPWSLDDVVARTYVNHGTARAVLEALQRRGLVAQDTGGYRFQPQDPADVALVARVASYYHANLVRVATLIHDRASAIKEFARAFDFKKDH
jgi:DNA-binding IclR family transcriptional regulator